MIDTLMKATILLALVSALAHLLRRRSAAIRHLLWTLAIVGLVALPILTATLPFRLPILPAATSARLATTALESTKHKQIVAEEHASVAESAPAPSTDDRNTSTAASRIDVARGLLLLWLGVVVVLLARFVIGFISVRRVAMRAAVVTDEGWLAVADRAGRALQLTRPFDLRMSDEAVMPFACGFVTPIIVLPALADTWSAERRVAVLTHEAAHISRGDLAMNVLSHVVRALYWFHPLAWLAAYRLRVEGERSCDDAVLRAGALPSDYADHLLSIVRTAGPTVPEVALAMARRSDFEGRLLAILEPGMPRAGLSRLRAAMVAALFLVAVVPLAAMTPDRRTAIGVLPLPPQADSQTSRQEPEKQQASPVAVDALITTLTDANPAVRLAAVSSLGSLGDPKAIAALAKALREDTDARVREAAAHSLGEIDDKRAVPALLDALKVERIAAVRTKIVEALSEIDDRTAVSGVSAVLKDPSAAVRRAAVSALGGFEDAAAVPALLTMVRDDDVEVRRKLAEALGQLEDHAAVDPLIGMTRDADAEVRANAIESLAHFEDQKALPAFITALKDANADVRQHATEAIGNLHDQIKSAPRALIDALNDQSADVRHNAAHALGHIGDEAAVPALKKATSDTNNDVRQAAAEALSEIGGAEALQVLMSLLKDSDADIRKIAAEALGKKRR